MTNIDLYEMVNQELEDFENEGSNRKNIRMIIDYSSSTYNLPEKEFKMTTPVLRVKLKSNVHIKNKSNKDNSLF